MAMVLCRVEDQVTQWRAVDPEDGHVGPGHEHRPTEINTRITADSVLSLEARRENQESWEADRR